MKLSQQYIDQPYLDPYKDQLPAYDHLIQERERLAPALDRVSVHDLASSIDSIPNRPLSINDFADDSVNFGSKEDFDSSEQEVLKKGLEALIPWRKGPFSYAGIEIDAEWRSNLKWDRLMDGAELDLSRKKILDIGCNNQYYMYRMLSHHPELVVGIDPMVRYYFHDLLNRKFGDFPQLDFELLGVESCEIFENFFDTVFFMGILYHRRNPIQTLQTVASTLKKGGKIVMESAGIPGKDSLCLFPESRYTKAPGYWFLPTETALANMLRRTGFCDVKTFCVYKLGTEEQRRTQWARFESLEDFLDSSDPSKTVEGYPAPIRIYMTAIKR